MPIDSVRFLFKHPNPRPEHPKGDEWTFEDILYHIVRCGIFHDSELIEEVHFVKEPDPIKPNELHIPGTIVFGLVMAVVLSPCNKNRGAIKGQFFFYGRQLSLPIASLWGRREDFIRVLDAMDTLLKTPNRGFTRTEMAIGYPYQKR